MDRLFRILVIIAVLLGLLGLAVMLVPWHTFIESKIKKTLGQHGLPDIQFHIDRLNWNGATVKDIDLGIAVPLQLGDVRLSYALDGSTIIHGSDLVYKQPDLAIKAETVSIQLKLQKTMPWTGTWEAKNITTPALPPLNGAGELTAQEENLNLTGQFFSADRNTSASFVLDYDFLAHEKSRLVVKTAAMPWNEGRLSAQNISLPLTGKHDISFPLQVENVSVDTLLKSLTGERATATGTVSGSIPVTIKANGQIILRKGELKSMQPGQIALSPDAIPGDNEQVQLVREVMKDFHYTTLEIGMEVGKNNQSSVRLTLAGNNPAAYEGRPVKLNVHLTGDVLNLIQQSIMPLLDPRLLLKQETR